MVGAGNGSRVPCDHGLQQHGITVTGSAQHSSQQHTDNMQAYNVPISAGMESVHI
jgi:hypothetical protein